MTGALGIDWAAASFDVSDKNVEPVSSARVSGTRMTIVRGSFEIPR
jgi:hypothetical protein